MAFFDLTAGEGYLFKKTSLVADRKSKSEEFADEQIDTLFSRWDRSGWTGTGIPRSIKQIAELLAVGKYLQIEYSHGNPEARDTEATRLMRDGMSMANRVIESGGPKDSSGAVIKPLATGTSRIGVVKMERTG